MKPILNLCYCLFSFVLLLSLSACDGGGGGGTSAVTSAPAVTSQSAASTLSGTVADGYLRGARVFLDRNGNRRYDSGEPMAISAAGGAFTLSINPGEGAKYSVVVEVIAGETVDEDTGQPVTDSYLLESPPGYWRFISPLTTLVSLEMQKNPTMTLQRAELNIKNKLGIDDDISLFEDYLAPPPAKAIEAQRTHKAAQVAASLLGSLRSEIAKNLGEQILQDEQQQVAYLVSDKILQHGTFVAEELNAERNLNQTANVERVTTAIREQIPPNRLNAAALQRAAQGVDQNQESRDTRPPGIKHKNVPAGAIVSVNAVVMVVFDKQIDPATISANAISLRRSGAYVSGVVDYNDELQRLRFTPNQMLFPDSTYEVVVSGQLADPLGNPIGSDLAWQFSTLFDLTPPPLAEIGPEQ